MMGRDGGSIASSQDLYRGDGGRSRAARKANKPDPSLVQIPLEERRIEEVRPEGKWIGEGERTR